MKLCCIRFRYYLEKKKENYVNGWYLRIKIIFFFLKIEIVVLSCKLLFVVVGCLMVILIVIGVVVIDVEIKFDVLIKV